MFSHIFTQNSWTNKRVLDFTVSVSVSVEHCLNKLKVSAICMSKDVKTLINWNEYLKTRTMFPLNIWNYKIRATVGRQAQMTMYNASAWIICNSEFAICHVVRQGNMSHIQNPSVVTNPTLEFPCILLPLTLPCRSTWQIANSFNIYYRSSAFHKYYSAYIIAITNVIFCGPQSRVKASLSYKNVISMVMLIARPCLIKVPSN